MEIGCLEPAPSACVVVAGRRQQQRLLGELRRSGGRAPPTRPPSGAVERSGNLGARRGGRQGEVASLLLRVRGNGRQPFVERALARADRSAGDRRTQQWMREAQARPVELEDTRSERLLDAVAAAGGALDQLDRRVGRSRNDPAGLVGFGRQRLQPLEHETLERLGHGQLLPGLDPAAAALERAGELQCEEGVAS